VSQTSDGPRMAERIGTGGKGKRVFGGGKEARGNVLKEEKGPRGILGRGGGRSVRPGGNAVVNMIRSRTSWVGSN